MQPDTSKEPPSRESERDGYPEFDNNLEDFSQEKKTSTVDDQQKNTIIATQERVLANATQSARADPEESRNGYAQSSDGAVTNHSSGPLTPGQTPENILNVGNPGNQHSWRSASQGESMNDCGASATIGTTSETSTSQDEPTNDCGANATSGANGETSRLGPCNEIKGTGDDETGMMSAVLQPDGIVPGSDGRLRQRPGNDISDKHMPVRSGTVYHEALEEVAEIVPIAAANASEAGGEQEGGGNDGREAGTVRGPQPQSQFREAGEGGERGGLVGLGNRITKVVAEEPLEVKQDRSKDSIPDGMREVPSPYQPPLPTATTSAENREQCGTENGGGKGSPVTEERAVSEVGLPDGEGAGRMGGGGRTGWDGMGREGSEGVREVREEYGCDSNEGRKVNPPSARSTVDVVEGKSKQSLDVREGEGDITLAHDVKREDRGGAGGGASSKNEGSGMEKEKGEGFETGNVCAPAGMGVSWERAPSLIDIDRPAGYEEPDLLKSLGPEVPSPGGGGDPILREPAGKRGGVGRLGLRNSRGLPVVDPSKVIPETSSLLQVNEKETGVPLSAQNLPPSSDPELIEGCQVLLDRSIHPERHLAPFGDIPTFMDGHVLKDGMGVAGLQEEGGIEGSLHISDASDARGRRESFAGEEGWRVKERGEGEARIDWGAQDSENVGGRDGPGDNDGDGANMREVEEGGSSGAINGERRGVGEGGKDDSWPPIDTRPRAVNLFGRIQTKVTEEDFVRLAEKEEAKNYGTHPNRRPFWHYACCIFGSLCRDTREDE